MPSAVQRPFSISIYPNTLYYLFGTLAISEVMTKIMYKEATFCLQLKNFKKCNKKAILCFTVI